MVLICGIFCNSFNQFRSIASKQCFPPCDAPDRGDTSTFCKVQAANLREYSSFQTLQISSSFPTADVLTYY